MTKQEVFDTADRLYRHMNPNSKMCTPNVAYELSEKWHNEWVDSKSELNLFDWCLKNKYPNQ